MKSEIFLDTSFVIALINDKDQYHAKAQSLALVYLRERLVVTSAVLLEIGNAFAKRFKAETVETINSLYESNKTEVIEVTRDIFQKGLAVYERFDDKDWGLVDCISFSIMWERGIHEALTFDDDFRQAGFVVLTD